MKDCFFFCFPMLELVDNASGSSLDEMSKPVLIGTHEGCDHIVDHHHTGSPDTGRRRGRTRTNGAASAAKNVRNDPKDSCTIRQLISLALAHLNSAALCTFVDLDLAARLSPMSGSATRHCALKRLLV
jgi:hypothetical protein